MVTKIGNKGYKALLLVAFGTSINGANRSYAGFEEKVKKKYPDLNIFWSFTSGSIRTKLKERGENVLSPLEAISYLLEQEYERIIVQSLHIVPGAEYSELQKTVNSFLLMPKNNKRIVLGRPLLFDHKSMLDVAQALLDHLPANRDANDAVVFMGHGTSHEANVYYPAMQFFLNKVGNHLFVATIEGNPVLQDVLHQIKKNKYKKVWLIPFLTTAGYHVRVDMNGNGEGTWRTVLEEEGFQVESVLSGVLDNPLIQNIWVENIGHWLEE